MELEQVMGLFFFTILAIVGLLLWLQNKYKKKKEEQDKIVKEEERKNKILADERAWQDSLNRREKQEYNELLNTNSFVADTKTSNLRLNMEIARIYKLKNNKYFNLSDFNFDIEQKETELKVLADKKMRESKISDFVSVDIETTGLSVVDDRIVQIAAVKIKDFEIIDTYTTYVNPKKRISAAASEITGITNDMVEDSPTIDSIFLEFIDFIENYPLVFHNPSFDYTK